MVGGGPVGWRSLGFKYVSYSSFLSSLHFLVISFLQVCHAFSNLSITWSASALSKYRFGSEKVNISEPSSNRAISSYRRRWWGWPSSSTSSSSTTHLLKTRAEGCLGIAGNVALLGVGWGVEEEAREVGVTGSNFRGKVTPCLIGVSDFSFSPLKLKKLNFFFLLESITKSIAFFLLIFGADHLVKGLLFTLDYFFVLLLQS